MAIPDDSKTKREELRTYKELSLGRVLKSERQRRRLAASGKKRVIGDHSLSQPHLLVAEEAYRAVRREMQLRVLREAQEQGLDLPPDILIEQLTPRIEALTYAVLAEQSRQSSAQQAANVVLGRGLTREEQERFAASSALTTEASTLVQMRSTGRVAHQSLHQILGQIEQRQTHNPARYQTLWAQIVGPDIAAQTRLEKVDPVQQIAYFRCFNSVLSMDLQRRPDLAKKLSHVLGQPIKKLKAQF